jgi:hypothetical protein
MADKWIQDATAKMKQKGTVGKFGKATEKKIAAGKREGGVRKKEAIFAENMKHMSKGPKKLGMHSKYSARHHQAIGSHEGHPYKGK